MVSDRYHQRLLVKSHVGPPRSEALKANRRDHFPTPGGSDEQFSRVADPLNGDVFKAGCAMKPTDFGPWRRPTTRGLAAGLRLSSGRTPRRSLQTSAPRSNATSAESGIFGSGSITWTPPRSANEAMVSYSRTDDFVDVQTGRPGHVAVRLTKTLRWVDGRRLFATSR